MNCKLCGREISDGDTCEQCIEEQDSADYRWEHPILESLARKEQALRNVASKAVKWFSFDKPTHGESPVDTAVRAVMTGRRAGKSGALATAITNSLADELLPSSDRLTTYISYVARDHYRRYTNKLTNYFDVSHIPRRYEYATTRDYGPLEGKVKIQDFGWGHTFDRQCILRWSASTLRQEIVAVMERYTWDVDYALSMLVAKDEPAGLRIHPPTFRLQDSPVVDKLNLGFDEKRVVTVVFYPPQHRVSARRFLHEHAH